MLIKHDKEFCLIKIANATKLAMQNIPQEMQNVVRERRKDKNGEFRKKYQKDYQTIALEKMSETVKLTESPSRRKSKLDEKKNQPKSGAAAFGLDGESKDVALVRFTKDYNKQ
jgi:hypothetical protein